MPQSWRFRLLQALRAGWLGARAALGVAGFSVFVTVVMTWPLAADAGHTILRAPYHWDAFANAMIMGSRVDGALGLGPLGLYDNYFFAPIPWTIVFNENHFGLSLLFLPFYLGGGPLLAYNLTLLTSLSLSVLFTYWLVRRLTGSGLAGIVSGIAFAFCPYVVFEMGRIQLVATQWIPACFLFLHRALEGRKRRDVIAFWSCFVLQIGTCLYYATFILPLLVPLAIVLAMRHRPPLRVYAWFFASGLVAGAVALLMVYPYFVARASFDLERTLDFASRYDGKLRFLTYAPERNHTWSALHHANWQAGAPEEIAFPGLAAALLALLSLGVLVRDRWRSRRLGARSLVLQVGGWVLVLLVTAWATLSCRSFLVGALLFVPGALLLARSRLAAGEQRSSGPEGVYFALLSLALVLFLGLEPLEWQGEPVHGLYYYLHTYVPGFNGVRKVSRQAIMTTFVLTVLAGFGAAWLLERLRSGWTRSVVFALLLLLVCFDLRCFPYPVQQVWAAEEPPPVLRFVASLPREELVTSFPQKTGRSEMHPDARMAFHNFLALHHKHRFVNGQSSWQTPASELARTAMEQLPDDASRRALLSLGARHLIVYGEELPPEKYGLEQRLAAQPQGYRLAFREGPHSVFSLLGAGDPSVSLLEVPPLPEGVRRVPASAVRPTASLFASDAPLAIDGRADTRWSTRRPQMAGQAFEVQLDAARRIRALEIHVPERVMDAPASFRLTAARGERDLGVLIERPTLRLYRQQVYSPKTFVFRVVLEQALPLDRLRIELLQAVPGHYFSIYELALYEE